MNTGRAVVQSGHVHSPVDKPWPHAIRSEILVWGEPGSIPKDLQVSPIRAAEKPVMLDRAVGRLGIVQVLVPCTRRHEMYVSTYYEVVFKGPVLIVPIPVDTARLRVVVIVLLPIWIEA